MLDFLRRKKKITKADVKPKRAEPKLDPSTLDPQNAVWDWAADGQNTAEKKLEFIQANALQVQPPAPQGVAMDAADSTYNYQASYNYVNPHVLNYYVASCGFIGYDACYLIGQHALVQRGCSMKVKDATKKWYEISIPDNEDAKLVTKIHKLDKKFKLKKNMVEAVNFRNIFGVRHVLFKHKNPNFDYSKPYNPDSFKNGGYAGISQIDPYWMTPELDNVDLTDPAAIGFYDPTYWIINGKRYHRSHFVIILGDEVADRLKPTYRYGGVSISQKIYERLYCADRSANEAPQLIQTKRLTVRKTNLAKAQANKAKFNANLASMVEYRDNYGVEVIDTSEELDQLDTNLADLDDNIMTQFQLVCSILGVPSTRMLGVSSAGFSTGDAEIETYLEDVEELQGGELTDIAMAHYERLIASEGFNIEDVDLNWRPLKVMSPQEIADTNLKKAQADQAWFNVGAVDNYDIRQRVADDIQSGYQGIEVPDDMPEPDGDDDGEA